MEPQVLFSPGALVPFSGRGSNQEAEEIAGNWAQASNGLIQYTARYTLRNFVWTRGRPPYGHCAASGYLAPTSSMVAVDGQLYIPEFAPKPKDSF